MTDDRHDRAPDTDIAIVGMAGRFPGAQTLDEFWRNLRDGVESIQTFSLETLREQGVPEALLTDPAYVRRGAVLDDMECFDGAFFGFSPKEAAIMDPQHRHFLECSWHALERAGHDPARFPGAIGVFGGSGMHAYLMYNLLSHPELIEETGMFLVRHTGNDKDFLTTRVSYALNLRGPSLNVQTACSTSLVAVHLACQHLLAGECDMALAGGATIELPHRVGYLAREGEILSPDGHCRPFDAASNGTVFGSGVGVVVLRRLADARADGDHIHAVIKGSAINNDGSLKMGYFAPSVDGQAAAIAEALAVAGVEADTVSYVETHGTGTAVGDPIEVTALTQAFRLGTDRRGFCAIGSVKSNIGHTDTAAGVASLIKATLAIEHCEIPPSLHYQAPNPAIDFAVSPFFVNDHLRPWPDTGKPRRAGVSSLGVGGTNAHVILEEAPAQTPRRTDARPWHLLPISAKTPAALDTATRNLVDHLRSNPTLALGDIAFTLQEGRAALPHRIVVACHDLNDAAAVLEQGDARRLARGEVTSGAPPLAFMFAGGGAQYPGMGAELYQHEPVYRAAIEECAALLDPATDAPLLDVLYPPEHTLGTAAAELERPSRALPALFATQYAEALLLRSWGIHPTAMIGHSMGEYTAACLAGVFTLRDALHLVALRGRLFERVAEGGMLSVQLDANELAPLLGPDLSIAAINAPGLAVASGPRAAISALEAELGRRQVECQPVHIAVAAHSVMLEPILEPFLRYLEGIVLSNPTIPFVSNLTGTWITALEACDPEYWVRHLRHTVRFADGIGTLLEGEPRRVLLEVGPGRTLATLSQMHSARRPSNLVTASLPRPGEDASALESLHAAVGRLWAAGADVDWRGMHGGQSPQRVPLPAYPFERRRHWIEPAPTGALGPGVTGVPGRAADIRDWFYQRAWRTSPAAPREAMPTLDWLLIYAGNDPFGERLVERASAISRRVVVAHAGDEFSVHGTDICRVRPGHLEDHAQALRLASASGGRGAILQAWTLGSSAAGDHRAVGFDALLRTVAATAEELDGVPVRLVTVTTGAQTREASGVCYPGLSMLPAALRVLPRELPELSCLAIDLATPPAGSWAEGAIADRVLDEVVGPLTGAVVLGAGGRLLETFEAIPVAKAQGRPALVRAGGVYLITGGLGGLGLIAAAELAEQGAGMLVLASRSGTAPRESWATLAQGRDERAPLYQRLLEIEARGVRVVTPCVDVTERHQVQDLVDRIVTEQGALHGVIHAAGVLADAPLLAKSEADIATIIAPKVAGALALDAAIGARPLDFFVLYSSISAVAGLPGQVDYAAANAFLDTFAAERTARTGGFTAAIGWPAWREVGMVATPATDAGMGPPADSPAHPLLHRRWDHDGEGVEFATMFRVSEHWVLDEHRLRSGEALIPGAGFLELARAAHEAVHGGALVECREVYFISPFVVGDETPRELRVVLSPGGECVIRSHDETQPGGWAEHARGVVSTPGDAPALGRVDLDEVTRRCDRGETVFTGTDYHRHLRFGPRWGALHRIRFGTNEALVELQLDPAYVGDLEHHALHPTLLDMATAGAQDLIAGYEPDAEFFVPVAYGRLAMAAPLPARCWSHVRYRPPGEDGREVAIFDVTITDERGVPVAQVEEFTMQLVGNADRLTVPAIRAEAGGRSAAVARALDLGIDPDEGREILRRVLDGRVPPHVVVSPFPLEYTLTELTISAVGGVPDRPLSRTMDTSDGDPDLGRVVAALRSHPAIRDACVVGKWDHPDERRLLAYIVPNPTEPMTISELRRHVRAQLPDNLVPPNFVEVDTLPRASDGTVLTEGLPDPFAPQDNHVAPRTTTEQWLAGIWTEVLGVGTVGLHDNFFDIGGHSLLGIRVITRVRKERGVRLSQADMVLQTLEQLAEECDRHANQPAEGVVT